VHVDHVALAEAIRKVAYMINVPHAFTPEYPPEAEADSGGPGGEARKVKVPAILTVFDTYTAEGGFDLVVDVDDVYDHITAAAWCHQSQFVEWLPWVARHGMPPAKSLEEWRPRVRNRFLRKNQLAGLPGNRATEYFNVSAWGDVPTVEQLLRDFPMVSREHSKLDRLRERLDRWRS
jgi:hypothetical protein